MDVLGNLYFTFFQLNTLDCANNDGVKNLVWFHKENLYHKMLHRTGMLRMTRYLDYNPVALDKLLAVYLNDVDINRTLNVSFKPKSQPATEE